MSTSNIVTTRQLPEITVDVLADGSAVAYDEKGRQIAGPYKDHGKLLNEIQQKVNKDKLIIKTQKPIYIYIAQKHQ